MSALAVEWAAHFYATLLNDRAVADDLKDSSLRADLGRWTATLTQVVVRSFEGIGLSAAAKGFRCAALPVKRNEYLGQDVMAFRSGAAVWQFPQAVCELENAAADALVAYSLWKVLCVQCKLRVVFCYRADARAGAPLVTALSAAVFEAMPIPDRAALTGDTLVIVGSRNEASTFPYGFFQAWKLNGNTGRFERFERR